MGPGIANRLPTTNKAFNEYLSNKCRNSFFIKPVTKFEIETEIKNLNSQKSPGYDGISVKIIKTVANEISEPISHIFNLTFLSGTIPDPIFESQFSKKTKKINFKIIDLYLSLLVFQKS